MTCCPVDAVLTSIFEQIISFKLQVVFFFPSMKILIQITFFRVNLGLEGIQLLGNTIFLRMLSLFGKKE